MKIRAITFDVGGTLIEPWPSVGHVYAEVADRHGVKVESAELDRRFVAAWRKRAKFAYSREAWAELVDVVFAGLADELPSRIFFNELYGRFAEPDTWRIFDDVRQALECLKERGMRLAVMSNWDERLQPLLERLELAEWFEEIFVSAKMGWAKPDERIFRAAAERLGVVGYEILHVGDSRREDLEGALMAGWQARHLVRGVNVDQHCQEQSITSLIELVEEL